MKFKFKFYADVIIFGETLEHLMNLETAIQNIKNNERKNYTINCSKCTLIYEFFICLI